MFQLMNDEAVVTNSQSPIYYDYSQRAWFANNCWYSDTNKAFVAVGMMPIVSAIAFKLLFSSSERIKAKQLRPTDEYLDDFWGLLDDPRTTEVNLGLASVQEAVEYTLAAVKAAGIELDVPSRKSEILSGQIL